ncbi:hypothetical protein [Flavobacterium ginsenosidimutans]|uniref:Lipoprotein n=1 Tax=Flavobacterium ginsenosidimutans TaxID=687844 RepID=A0ABZ2Q887_9FLAO|nr:hypothetical protein [Flavobacterium ginsenosidimutans]KAF2337870.1 hypothetical protein DM444_01880 [Flavobacterium ginsenosidimutans]
MKKFLLSLAFISLISCSKDDDYKEKKYNGPRYMDPPVWIQGTWKDNKDRMIQFTEDNLLYKYPMQKYTSATTEIFDYERYYLKEYGNYQNPNVQEVELIDYYSIKYNCLNDAPSKKFSFIRISESEIESTGLMPGIYIKQ